VTVLNQLTTDVYLGPGLGQAQKCGIVKPVNAYITNTAWVHAQLCKLQERVHSTRSHK
jgi:hypothetical protein